MNDVHQNRTEETTIIENQKFVKSGLNFDSMEIFFTFLIEIVRA